MSIMLHQFPCALDTRVANLTVQHHEHQLPFRLHLEGQEQNVSISRTKAYRRYQTGPQRTS